MLLWVVGVVRCCLCIVCRRLVLSVDAYYYVMCVVAGCSLLFVVVVLCLVFVACLLGVRCWLRVVCCMLSLVLFIVGCCVDCYVVVCL